MVSALTAPLVEATELLVHKDGNLTSNGLELPSPMKGAKPFALLDDIGCTLPRKTPHEQMDVIGLNGQAKNDPSFFLALLFKQLLAPLFDVPGKDRFAAPEALNEMVHHQMDAVLIALILKCVCLLYMSTIQHI